MNKLAARVMAGILMVLVLCGGAQAAPGALALLVGAVVMRRAAR